MNRTRVMIHVLLMVVMGVPCFAQDSDASAEKKAKPASDHVVLKVGNVEVTRAEFESRIGDIEPQSDPDKGSDVDKDRRKLGDDYASVMMLSQEALANHLDTTPEVSRQLAVDRLQILSDAQFQQMMRESKPNAEEISQYYNAHLSEFERVRVRRLFIWKLGPDTKNTRGLSADAAKARADAIVKASVPGGDADALAEEFKGVDYGLLDPEAIPFVRGELPAKLDQVAFSMKEGQWAIAEETPDRISLLRLIKHEPRPLSEVSTLIEQRLRGQKMEAKLDELKKKTGIWMDEHYFGKGEAADSDREGSASGKDTKLRKSAEKRGDNQ